MAGEGAGAAAADVEPSSWGPLAYRTRLVSRSLRARQGVLVGGRRRRRLEGRRRGRVLGPPVVGARAEAGGRSPRGRAPHLPGARGQADRAEEQPRVRGSGGADANGPSPDG